MVRQLTDDEIGPVREEVERFLASRPDLGPADLAQFTKLAESTVRSFIRGCIPGGREVVAEMRRVIELARAGEILQPGGARQSLVVAENERRRVRRVAQQGTFYETQTVQRIAEVLDYCAEHSAIGVVTADFGVGKTEAVKAWQRKHHGVECTVFEFDEFASTNKVDFVRCLAGMYGIQSNLGSQNAGIVFRKLCEVIRQNPGFACLRPVRNSEAARVPGNSAASRSHGRCRSGGGDAGGADLSGAADGRQDG